MYTYHWHTTETRWIQKPIPKLVITLSKVKKQLLHWTWRSCFVQSETLSNNKLGVFPNQMFSYNRSVWLSHRWSIYITEKWFKTTNLHSSTSLYRERLAFQEAMGRYRFVLINACIVRYFFTLKTCLWC